MDLGIYADEIDTLTEQTKNLKKIAKSGKWQEFGKVVRKLNVEYLWDQIYLDPHPDELNLLNQL